MRPDDDGSQDNSETTSKIPTTTQKDTLLQALSLAYCAVTGIRYIHPGQINVFFRRTETISNCFATHQGAVVLDNVDEDILSATGARSRYLNQFSHWWQKKHEDGQAYVRLRIT